MDTNAYLSSECGLMMKPLRDMVACIVVKMCLVDVARLLKNICGKLRRKQVIDRKPYRSNAASKHGFRTEDI